MRRVLPTRSIKLVLPLVLLLSALRPTTPASAYGTGKEVPAKFPRTEPLSFEENVGQFDSAVRFQAQAYGGQIFFNTDGVTLAVPVAERVKKKDAANQMLAQDGTQVSSPSQAQSSAARDDKDDKEDKERVYAAIRFGFVGATASTTIEASGRQQDARNYFLGSNASQWYTNVASYDAITYKQLWNGIDVRYDSVMGKLKGTYLVAPNANPQAIRWR